MNNTLKAIIIDDNSIIVNNIIKHYKNSSLVNVVNSFADGSEALSFIVSNSDAFDVIIMDRILSGVDGLILLENLKSSGINKKVIIISDYKDEYLLKIAANYNIISYYIKPVSMIALDRSFNLIKESKEVIMDLNLDMEISQILHNLGIPSHIRGYKYIRDGISLLYNDETISLITKEIYPTIAIKYDTTPSRVERAIRHAIEVSWLRGDLSLMEELFGYSISCEKSKPTNSEFLLTIADRLKFSSIN